MSKIRLMAAAMVMLLSVVPSSANLVTKDCDCYSVNGNWFTARNFQDFRNQAIPDRTPPKVTDDDNAGEEDGQTGYLTGTEFSNWWDVQDWGKNATDDFPIMMQNSPANIYIESSSAPNATSHLTLRTYRLPSFQSAAEMEFTPRDIFRGSLEVLARVSGAPGAVAGLFTYYDATNETDIEILTRDPTNRIRYTNQPDVDDDGDQIPGASSNIKLAGDSNYEEWALHRIDWLDNLTIWYYNGKEVHRTSWSVPNVASYFVLNMWSDGGEWSGTMKVGSEAVLNVAYVDLIYNTSQPLPDPDTGSGHHNKRDSANSTGYSAQQTCKNVCYIDGGRLDATHPSSKTGASAAMQMKSGTFQAFLVAFAAVLVASFA